MLPPLSPAWWVRVGRIPLWTLERLDDLGSGPCAALARPLVVRGRGIPRNPTALRTGGPPLVLNSEMGIFGTHMHVVVLRNGPLGPLGKATTTGSRSLFAVYMPCLLAAVAWAASGPCKARFLVPINGSIRAPRGRAQPFPRVGEAPVCPYWPYQPIQWVICPEIATE